MSSCFSFIIENYSYILEWGGAYSPNVYIQYKYTLHQDSVIIYNQGVCSNYAMLSGVIEISWLSIRPEMDAYEYCKVCSAHIQSNA